MTDRVAIWQALLRSLGLALIALLAAVVARRYLLGALETRIVWVTFYPAVIVVSLLGGWLAGALTAAGSSLIAIHAWRFLADRPFIVDLGDWLGLGAFLFNCALVIGVAGMARHAHEQALRAKEQAEIASRAKSVFLANMSHELRTPLNAILGFTRLLRGDPALSAGLRDTLGLISRSGEHLLALINNVLEMAKIEAGRTPIEEVACDLPALARECVSLMTPRAEVRGLHLRLEVQAGLPRYARTDEAKVRQILLNLVSNALKFTEHGEVILSLGGEPGSAADRFRLKIRVKDTGIGIPPADRKRIFEPFVQLQHHAEQRGSGLGLAITRQFVALLGGAVTVESQVGRGSIFQVDLPMETVTEAPVRPDIGADERPMHLAAGQPAYRILIVEDTPENALLLRRLLEAAGFEVRTAENGAAGVEAFAAWRPHFIWMDWRMPVMDGVEATRRIRQMEGGKAVKIAVLSASVFKSDRDLVLAAGADEFVAKPFRFGAIYRCLGQQLGVRFSADESPVESPATVGLDRSAAAALPPALREELAASVLSLDAARISTAVGRVDAINPRFAAALRDCACQFRYTAMLRAFRTESNEPR
jgi:signal transduction histidine kinase/ActR/RegA family two-component response regulator